MRFHFLLLSLLFSSLCWAQLGSDTEADFCVSCAAADKSISKAATPLADIVSKADEDFFNSNFLDPELVEKMDSRKMGELIVSRLKNVCDKSRDPSQTPPADGSSEIVMLINEKNIEPILKYGFKNQQQTSTTNGSDAKQSRIMAESRHVMIGLPYTDKTRELLPKYAMQVFHGQPKMGTFPIPTNYGNILIRFKPDVRKRATWSEADSLGVSDPLRTQSLRTRDGSRCNGYCEAQIWGDLDASDIESITLPDDKDASGYGYGKVELSETLKKYGVPIYTYTRNNTGSTYPSYSPDGRPVPTPTPSTEATVFSDSTIPSIKVSKDPIYTPEVKTPPPRMTYSAMELKDKIATETSKPVLNILKSSLYSKTPTNELLESCKKSIDFTKRDPNATYYGADLGSENLRKLSELSGREKTHEVTEYLKQVMTSDVDASYKAMALPGLLHLPWEDFKPILMDSFKQLPKEGATPSPYGSGPSGLQLKHMAAMIALDHADDSDIQTMLNSDGRYSEYLSKLKNHKFCTEERYSP